MPLANDSFNPQCVVLHMNLNLLPKQLPSIILAATANSSPNSHFSVLKENLFLATLLRLNFFIHLLRKLFFFLKAYGPFAFFTGETYEHRHVCLFSGNVHFTLHNVFYCDKLTARGGLKYFFLKIIQQLEKHFEVEY